MSPTKSKAKPVFRNNEARQDPVNDFGRKTEGAQRRDPVYDLFTFNDDPNIANCQQENCSAKLAVNLEKSKSSSLIMKFFFQKKATTLKRHLLRFHKAVHETLMAEICNRSQASVVKKALDSSAENKNIPAELKVNEKKLRLILPKAEPKTSEKARTDRCHNKSEESKVAEKIRCRDLVYDLFTPCEDDNFVVCNHEYCSAKLSVSSRHFLPSKSVLMKICTSRKELRR